MKMRRKAMRGESYKTQDGTEYRVLESFERLVRCIDPAGKIVQVAKDDLDLPVIDTAFYERIHDLSIRD